MHSIEMIPWFTVFATLVLCILLGIRIYTIYVDYVYIDGYSASQALSLITMRVMKALPYVMLTCFVLVITVFPIVHLLRKRKQSCRSESSQILEDLSELDRFLYGGLVRL